MRDIGRRKRGLRAKREGRGGEGLTEVDRPVCFCYVLRDPVACICVYVSWFVCQCVCVALHVFINGSTHSTATVKHMLACLVCSSAI